MKRVLVLCSSPYQLLVAIQLKEQFFKDDEVSIALGDTIANASDLFNRLRQDNTFIKAFLWKIRELFNLVCQRR